LSDTLRTGQAIFNRGNGYVVLQLDPGQIDTFKLMAKTHQQALDVSEEARSIILKHYRTPEALKAVIEAHGTPVFVIKEEFIGKLLLKTLGYEVGFVPANDSFQYHALVQFLTHAQPDYRGDTEHGLFIVTAPLLTIGFLSHQLHHWLSHRSGLSGYTTDEQLLYQEFWNRHNGQLTDRVLRKMTPDDMLKLKNVINRDLEALRFLRQIVDEIFIPAKEGANIIETAQAKARAANAI